MDKEKGLIVDGLLDVYELDGWEPVVEALDIYAKRRSVSGALISLCIFHGDKTPSFWMYPSERAICYGCGAHGTRGDVIAQQTILQPSIVLNRLGIPTLDVIMKELDAEFMDNTKKISERNQMYAVLAENEEPF